MLGLCSAALFKRRGRWEARQGFCFKRREKKRKSPSASAAREAGRVAAGPASSGYPLQELLLQPWAGNIHVTRGRQVNRSEEPRPAGEIRCLVRADTETTPKVGWRGCMSWLGLIMGRRALPPSFLPCRFKISWASYWSVRRWGEGRQVSPAYSMWSAPPPLNPRRRTHCKRSRGSFGVPRPMSGCVFFPSRRLFCFAFLLAERLKRQRPLSKNFPGIASRDRRLPRLRLKWSCRVAAAPSFLPRCLPPPSFFARGGRGEPGRGHKQAAVSLTPGVFVSGKHGKQPPPSFFTERRCWVHGRLLLLLYGAAEEGSLGICEAYSSGAENARRACGAASGVGIRGARGLLREGRTRLLIYGAALPSMPGSALLPTSSAASGPPKISTMRPCIASKQNIRPEIALKVGGTENLTCPWMFPVTQH